MITHNKNIIISLTILTIAAFAATAGTALAVTTTITGTANGPTSSGFNSDSWNNPDNWDNGVPSGDTAAVISGGLAAQANGVTPTYSGGLTMNENSSLRIGGVDGPLEARFALGTGGIIMNDGCEILITLKYNNLTYPALTMAGNAQITSASTQSHSKNYIIGSVTGDGTLTVSGTNRNLYRFNAGNPAWSGGLVIKQNSNNNVWVEADAPGCLGTGNVTSETGTTLQIDAGDAMGDTATLTLNGDKRSEAASKLIMNANDTIGGLIIDGFPQAFGEYTEASGSWITGTGTLTVTSADPETPDVEAGPDWTTWSGQPVTAIADVTNNDVPPLEEITYEWTADDDSLNDENLTIEITPDAADPNQVTVNVTKNEPTGYPTAVTITLTVTLAGHPSAIDRMTIDVYDNSCKAAIALDMAMIDPGDLNRDCYTNLADFAEIAAQWLVDYIITEAKPKDALEADFDGNYKIDLGDFAVIAQKWGNGTGINDLIKLAETWLNSY